MRSTWSIDATGMGLAGEWIPAVARHDPCVRTRQRPRRHPRQSQPIRRRPVVESSGRPARRSVTTEHTFARQPHRPDPGLVPCHPTNAPSRGCHLPTLQARSARPPPHSSPRMRRCTARPMRRCTLGVWGVVRIGQSATHRPGACTSLFRADLVRRRRDGVRSAAGARRGQVTRTGDTALLLASAESPEDGVRRLLTS